MKAIYKIIGTTLWMLSGLFLVMAMMTVDMKGINATVFDIIKWTFCLAFIMMTPVFMGMMYSNTMFLTEKAVQHLKKKLIQAIQDYNDSQVAYRNATADCMMSIRHLRDYLKLPTKEQRIADIDELFNNTPLDSEMTKIREKVLEYLRNCG